jgi:hypothetical protein
MVLRQNKEGILYGITYVDHKNNVYSMAVSLASNTARTLWQNVAALVITCLWQPNKAALLLKANRQTDSIMPAADSATRPFNSEDSILEASDHIFKWH